MEELFADLRPIDNELMRLKKVKYDNGDPYGTLENALEDKIEGLYLLDWIFFHDCFG